MTRLLMPKPAGVTKRVTPVGTCGFPASWRTGFAVTLPGDRWLVTLFRDK